MLIVHVHVKVRPEFVQAFRAVTVENARNSVKEPGIARFDVLQNAEEPTEFTLVEIYRNVDATHRHKETPHYVKWRDAVADMMAEPRTAAKFSNVFPGDDAF